MNKVAVVYWSGTGNTEAMAAAVAEGAKEAGAEVTTFEADAFSAEKMAEFDTIAFGCPAMGDETLEEDIFEPMFASCKEQLNGRTIGLFGSYGWGDGDWMRSWEEECKAAGASLVQEPVLANEAPDSEAEASCRALGKALAQ